MEPTGSATFDEVFQKNWALEMVILTCVTSLVFLLLWIATRKRRSDAQISDIFVIGFAIIFLPFFIANTSAVTRFNTPPFSAEVVNKSVAGIIVFMSVGGIFFVLRMFVGHRLPAVRREVPDLVLNRCALAALVISTLLFAGLMTSECFRTFKADIFRWLSGEVHGQEYANLRRLHSGPFLDGLLGRLRFAIMPVLLLFLITPFCRKSSIIRTAIITMAFFMLLPLSFSKLPFVYYVGYALIFAYLTRTGVMSLRSAVSVSVVGSIGSVMLIATLYLAQYKGSAGYQNIYDEPVRLAIDRMWGESYSVILRYFATYPEQLAHTGWSGLSLPSKLIGIEFRNPDIEVTTTVLGPNSGSNPGIFFLAGYAAFGYVGIALYSAIGFGLLWLFDVIADRMTTKVCHQIYFSIMALNVLFLLQIALQTTLLSYGLAVVPLAVIALDRVLVRFAFSPKPRRQSPAAIEKTYI